MYTPADGFPPHGYLDNPYHAWKLNPSGVLRSRQPAGMGWHVPNYGSYGRNQFAYRAHLHVGLAAAGQRLLTPAEFAAAGVTVGCDRHTKNRLRDVFSHPAGVRLAAEYFLAAEHALGCRVELAAEDGAALGAMAAEGDAGAPIRLWLAQEIAHNSATSRAWEHGLYTVLPDAGEPAIGAVGLVGVCPEGDVWALGASRDGALLTPSLAALLGEPWLAEASGDARRAPREPVGLQTATLLLAYDLALPGDGAPVIVEAAFARGPSPDAARAALHAALSGGFGAAFLVRADEDERFWASAPQLSGDWPDTWRRGFVTDLETLRMVARPPAGIFAARWDGMQIQAPRIVLAEAALDALALGWADPVTARELLLTCFASAPRPNVACMREDGSYNMIADDGAVCGTGPEWGWPFAVIDALWRRSGDSTWLQAIYPGASAYLNWWRERRRDAEGWLVHACSWESGQDVSTRFGEQSTGGSDVRHLRPVDLQAAAAQGYRLLEAWAGALGRPAEERDTWRSAKETFLGRTREMWRDGWFRDFDTRRGRWPDVRDPMQLAPLACELAADEQIEVLRTAFDALPPHAGVYPPMVWPPVALSVLEAALAAGRGERAAELAAAILERAWRRMDRRELEPDGAIPGVTREYWPEYRPESWPERDAQGAVPSDVPSDVPSAGIEGYGWGALTIHFLVRHLVGLREQSPDRFRLTPALPPTLRHCGARFIVGPLAYAGGHVTVTYAIPEGAADEVAVTLGLDGIPGGWVARDEESGRELARATVGRDSGVCLAWRGAWLRTARVERDWRPL